MENELRTDNIIREETDDVITTEETREEEPVTYIEDSDGNRIGAEDIESVVDSNFIIRQLKDMLDKFSISQELKESEKDLLQDEKVNTLISSYITSNIENIAALLITSNVFKTLTNFTFNENTTHPTQTEEETRQAEVIKIIQGEI